MIINLVKTGNVESFKENLRSVRENESGQATFSGETANIRQR